MVTERARLLEMALRGLEAERGRINQEIEEIQMELRAGGKITAARSSSQAARRKPKFSVAERRRRAERMRQYWAKRKAAEKTGPAATSARRKPKFSAAERRRRAERMHQYWARQRKSRQ